jgi:hypothetical protein
MLPLRLIVITQYLSDCVEHSFVEDWLSLHGDRTEPSHKRLELLLVWEIRADRDVVGQVDFRLEEPPRIRL